MGFLRTGDCGCSPEQSNAMFKKSEQYIDQMITERKTSMARYWIDLYDSKPFPDGVGLSLDKLRFYPDIGPQDDGFDGWRQVQVSRGKGDECGEHDACGYNWERVGHGLETVSYSLMKRDLATDPICVEDIRTFFQYQEMQNMIFNNLSDISLNIQENLNRNAAHMFAIKYMAMSGFPTNRSDPHQFPTIPSGVELGKLTYRLLLQLYHNFIQDAAPYAMGNINGYPAIGVVASSETLHDMTYEDPEIRADMRKCTGTQCALIEKYNFLDSIGPFILMPDMFAPRYDRDADGNLHRVFPYNRNMPIEVGSRTITNPAYYTAEFEHVLFLTQGLFNLRTRRPISTVGGQTSFDAALPLFQWKWWNPPGDPYNRKGWYVTTGEVAVEPGDFTDTAGVLVKRKPGYVGIEFWGAEVCPPDPVECDNVLPEMPCPCPRIIGMYPTTEPLELLFVFDRDAGVAESETVELETVNGSFASGTAGVVSVDGTRVTVAFAAVPCADPGHYVGIDCLGVSYCSAKVLRTEMCGIIAGNVKVTLNRPIKATGTETVTLVMGDGTLLDRALIVTGTNTSLLEYVVTITWADYCNYGGICGVCVPPETDDTCPDCDASLFEVCVDES